MRPPTRSVRAISLPMLSDPDGFAQAISALETIDLVVHAAGTLGGTYARKQTFEQWQTIISANLDSCFVVTAAVLPRMRAGSRLVFISSSAAHEPMMARTAYSASKAGMNAFARALALEVDRDGIAVHIVTPGPVETEMLQDVPFEMNAIQVSDVAEAVAWLDTVDPSVDLPEIRLSAVRRGPFAREPVVPTEARRRRRIANDAVGLIPGNALITVSPNSCSDVRGGEIGEPDVEPLDTLGGQAGEMSDQLVGIAADKSRPEIAESPGAHLAHVVRIAALADKAHHLLNRYPGRSRRPEPTRASLIEVVGRYVPPIRISPNKFHHPAPGSAQDQRYRMGSRSRRCAAGPAPSSPQYCLIRPRCRSSCSTRATGSCLTDIESGELRGPGARAEAELEPAVRGLRQGDGLFGQHGRMAKSVAEHQMADP